MYYRWRHQWNTKIGDQQGSTEMILRWKKSCQQLLVAAFLVCQACISAIGCKSRIRFTVRSISQEQGCRGRLRIWRKLAANIRAYEKKLHTRRGATGNVAKQTEARYCTELHNVNAEAAWMESGYTYPERTDNKQAEICENVKAATSVRV